MYVCYGKRPGAGRLEKDHFYVSRSQAGTFTNLAVATSFNTWSGPGSSFASLFEIGLTFPTAMPAAHLNNYSNWSAVMPPLSGVARIYLVWGGGWRGGVLTGAWGLLQILSLRSPDPPGYATAPSPFSLTSVWSLISGMVCGFAPPTNYAGAPFPSSVCDRSSHLKLNKISCFVADS